MARVAKLVSICLSTVLSACGGSHVRPPNVPPSAVRVDNTFIDCSTDPKSVANRCTVYKDGTGDILADGLFSPKNSHTALDKSELQYAAYGDGTIFLQDARVLVLWAASERDPSNLVNTKRLRSVAANGTAEAIDCRKAAVGGSTEKSADCVLRAFAEKRAFYVSYYRQYIASFGFDGLAGDVQGNVYGVEYYSNPRRNGGWPRASELFDGNHTLVLPCPMPVVLSKTFDGQLTCARPVARPD
jgi:hypothetical protein